MKSHIYREAVAGDLMHIFWNLLIGWLVLLASVSYAGWTPAVRISDEGPSYGPRTAANADALHVVYWRGGSFTSSYYVRSDDDGNTWGEPFHLPDTTHMSNNVKPIIRLEGNRILVIWRGDIRGGGSDLNYGLRLSTNEGINWNNIEYILAQDQESLQKHAFYISNSVLYLIHSRINQGEIALQFMESTDWGENWADPTEVFRTQETGPFCMVASGNTIHFVWVGRFNYDDEWEIYYLRSTDSGGSWSENTMLSTPDTEGSDWPSMAINDQGELIVCWMDYKYSPNLWRGDLFVKYSYNAGESWTEEEQITFTHDALYPNIIWQGDSIHVVWEDWRFDQGDIFYMLSEDNGTTWGEQQRIEDDPGMSLAPDLSVVDETVHVVWRQDSGLDGRGIYYSRWDEVSEIPTLSEWGMLILALLLLAAGTLGIVFRERTALGTERG